MLPVLLLLILFQSPAEAQAPAAAPVRSTAAIEWLDAAPTAGEDVLIRLRGAALNAWLDGDYQVQLTNGGEPLESRLLLPVSGVSPVPRDLPFSLQTGAAADDLQVLIDRGTSTFPLNRVSLTFSAPTVRAKVHMERSDDATTYVPAGDDQLIYQALHGGEVWDFTELAIDASDSRYLRLTVMGLGDIEVQSVRGWNAPPAPPMYSVPVSLGPMQTGADGNIWPLIVQRNDLPLLKLKLAAKGDTKWRRLSIARLDDAMQQQRSVALMQWLNEVPYQGLSRGNRWVELPVETHDEPWGIVVEDGKDAPLQLSSIQAYAADVLLSFTMPEQSDPQIEFTPLQAGAAAPTAETGALPGRLAGQVSVLEPVAEADAPGSSLPFAGLWQSLAAKTDGWLLPATYLAAALLALVIGMALLRRRQAAD